MKMRDRMVSVDIDLHLRHSPGLANTKPEVIELSVYIERHALFQ